MRSHSLSKPQDPNADLDLGDGDFDFDPLLLSRSSPGPGGISHGPAALTPVAPVPPDESGASHSCRQRFWQRWAWFGRGRNVNRRLYDQSDL